MKTVELERIKYGLRLYLPENIINNMTITQNNHLDFMSDQIGLAVKGMIWGEEGKRIVIDYPADWWQAVKDRFFPAWALRWWPVKYIHHEITPATVYPYLNISLPKEQKTVILRHSDRIRYQHCPEKWEAV